MPPIVRSQAELQTQRTKLASSYNALLEEFSSADLHSVGNYSLGSLIGKGSFGKVYLATHNLTNGSKVVLKSAKKEDPNLAREIHHHRQFIHPHIARLYEVIVTESLVWLALEYCPGDELYNYLTKTGPLDPATTQKIFTQLVGAVSYVHSKSCVHRDLKLENILLDKHQDVKLVDFGFTREYEGKSNNLQTWCGTVCYSAPEMIKGEKYAAERVDVWSLGIILYALLAGELPFDEDEEQDTKMKILKDEPNYPDTFPEGARELVGMMLSKRPLLRPSLAEILTHSWLSEHAPQQQAILKLQQPPPFSTDLEKDVLQRMKSAGVNIDTVIENVLSQRCDAMAGWWALLLEKEDRKAKRRDRKRKEKEAEVRSLRRMSVASSRLDRIAPTIHERDEENSHGKGVEPGRGREVNRQNGHAGLPRIDTQTENFPVIRTPSQRTGYRASSASRRRPSHLATPREQRKRLSARQIMTHSAELTAAAESMQKEQMMAQEKKAKKNQPQFMNSIKQWFKQSAQRAKSPKRGGGLLSPALPFVHKDNSERELKRVASDIGSQRPPSLTYRPDLVSSRMSYPSRPRIATHSSGGSVRRLSQSPSPLTPSSSYRRSAGLRGRKSTSSSVSSIRSMHPAHPTHSKASSTSSNSAVSPSMSAQNFSALAARKSPRNSLKVLPAAASTPTSSSFPSHSRLARGKVPPALNLGGELRADSTPAASGQGTPGFSAFGPPSPGLVFAKRRRTPFRGPMLGPGASRRRSEATSISRSGSVDRRSGGAVIEEEDEDEDIEEVDAFTPVEGEVVIEDPFDATSPATNPHAQVSTPPIIGIVEEEEMVSPKS